MTPPSTAAPDLDAAPLSSEDTGSTTLTAFAARSWGRVRVAVTPAAVAIAALYLVSSLFNVLAWNHTDLTHTVGSSYAYLLGHPLDFYDYDAKYFLGNDYFPTIYALFAAWMAPVKLLVSPGVQNVQNLSGWEIGWARLGLLLTFWATAYVLHLIAKELFPHSARRRRTVVIAFLLSPVALVAFNLIGQYDIIGVLFTCLGVLYWLRGDKWKFALFFSLAISCKYFALLIFVPLLVLQFKKFRQIIPLFLVGLSVSLVEIAIYVDNSAFRHHTLFSLVGGTLEGGTGQTIMALLEIVLIVGIVVLWRYRATSLQQMHFVAIHAILVIYGLVMASVDVAPYWLILLAPWTACMLGYLKRPVWFLLWEVLGFVGLLAYMVNTWPVLFDAGMITRGVLGKLFLGPHLLLGDVLFPHATLSGARILLFAYLISPIFFVVLDHVFAPPPADAVEGPRVPSYVWWMRVLAFPLLWTVPSLILLFAPPLPTAYRIDPLAAVTSSQHVSQCDAPDTAYGEIIDGVVATQSFTSTLPSLRAVSVRIASYERPASGQLSFTLRDADGAALAHSTADMSTLADDATFYAVFDRGVADAQGRRFTVTVSTAGTHRGQGIGLWGQSEPCGPAGAVSTLKGKPTQGGFDFAYYSD